MAKFEVTVKINGNDLGSVIIEAENEDEAHEVAENGLDVSDTTMSLTGTICLEGGEFNVNEEFMSRDVDIEEMFGPIEFDVIALED